VKKKMNRKLPKQMNCFDIQNIVCYLDFLRNYKMLMLLPYRPGLLVITLNGKVKFWSKMVTGAIRAKFILHVISSYMN
jgi:hypothetical protein